MLKGKAVPCILVTILIIILGSAWFVYRTVMPDRSFGLLGSHAMDAEKGKIAVAKMEHTKQLVEQYGPENVYIIALRYENIKEEPQLHSFSGADRE